MYTTSPAGPSITWRYSSLARLENTVAEIVIQQVGDDEMMRFFHSKILKILTFFEAALFFFGILLELNPKKVPATTDGSPCVMGEDVPWRWQKRLSEVLVYNGYIWPSQKKIGCPCKETTKFRFDHILVTKSSKHSWEVHFILIQQVPFSRGEIGLASVICGVVCRLTVGGPEMPSLCRSKKCHLLPPAKKVI